jgi:hypothetical protein
MRASQIVAFCASVLVAIGLSGVTAGVSLADVPSAPEMTGVLQDWNVESRYMVVGGVRYEFGDDFVLLNNSNELLPIDSARVGAEIRFWNRGGTVETVILLDDGKQQ